MPRKINKISETQILEIVIKRLSGQTQAEIAKELEVSEQTSIIKRNRRHES